MTQETIYEQPISCELVNKEIAPTLEQADPDTVTLADAALHGSLVTLDLYEKEISRQF